MGWTAVERLRGLAPAGLSALAAFALYAGTLGYGLVWDDPILLGSLAEAFHREGWRGILLSPFHLEGTRFYRPLVELSLFLDARLSRGFPPALHLTNVLLHALVTLLTAVLVGGVLRSRRAALAAGLLFAAHPAHVESVAFVSGRTDLWAALFALLGALAWQRDRERPGRGVGAWRFLGALSFPLALLSKEAAFLLPPVLLAWDLLLARAVPPERPWRARNAFWLGAWAVGAALVLALRSRLPRDAAGRVGAALLPGGLPDLAELPRLAAKLLTYLRLLAVPWPLSPYYTWEQVTVGAATLLGALLLLALCLLVAGRTRGHAGLLALLWILGFLLPVLAVADLRAAVVAERYLYLPSVGLAFGAGALWEAVAARRGAQRAALGAALALLLLLGAGTVAQSAVWRDAPTLFAEVVRKAPSWPFGHNNLGNSQMERGRYTEAVASYRRAVELAPAMPQLHYNLGSAYMAVGDAEGAREAFRRTLALDPYNAESHNNLGVIADGLGRPEEALASYAQALRIRPDLAEAHFNVGVLLVRQGRRAEAAARFREALRLRPEYREAGENLQSLERFGPAR